MDAEDRERVRERVRVREREDKGVWGRRGKREWFEYH